MDQPNNSYEADKKRFWLRIAGSLAALLALAAVVWFGRSYYRQFKEKREAAQAQAFLAKGDYRNAMLSARQALQLNPTNVPVCRVMAALAELSHNPAALDWQRRIVQSDPTVEDKLQLAAAALRYQSPPFPLATQILDELAPAATNLASYQVAAAGLALGLRRLDEAESHFAAAARLDPTNQLYALNLAIVRLGATNATQAVPARAVLENLRTDANLGPPALRALLVDRLAHQDISAAEAYSTQLLASAHATLADQLQHLGIERQLHREDFPARLQTLQRQSATNAPAVAQIAGWMEANNLLAGEIQWLTNLPAGLQAQMPVRLALAEAYLQAADWRALRDFTARGNWEGMEFLRLALLSRAWSQLGMPSVADGSWSSAVTAAGVRYSALTTLLELTGRWNLPGEREDLLQRIATEFPRELWARRALEQIYFTAGNTAALQQLYAKLISIFPKDPVLKNNLAFTCLLLKTNQPQACRWAAEVYAGRTNDAVVATTYALALHVQGRNQDGLAVLQKLDARRLHQPDAALYYAVLLAATGDTNAAAPFLKIARTKTGWLPEEKKLLSMAAGEL